VGGGGLSQETRYFLNPSHISVVKRVGENVAPAGREGRGEKEGGLSSAAEEKRIARSLVLRDQSPRNRGGRKEGIRQRGKEVYHQLRHNIKIKLGEGKEGELDGWRIKGRRLKGGLLNERGRIFRGPFYSGSISKYWKEFDFRADGGMDKVDGQVIVLLGGPTKKEGSDDRGS